MLHRLPETKKSERGGRSSTPRSGGGYFTYIIHQPDHLHRLVEVTEQVGWASHIATLGASPCRRIQLGWPSPLAPLTENEQAELWTELDQRR